MQHVSNKLIAPEDIVAKLTVEDMLACDSRVTPGADGKLAEGFGVEIIAKSTGLPVTETLNTFESQAVAEGLANRWNGVKTGTCPMHKEKRRYLVMNPWVCTCGYVFWHNLRGRAQTARLNEIKADTAVLVERNKAAVVELSGLVEEMRTDLTVARVRMAADQGDDELAALITEIGRGGWPYREAS